MYHNIILCTMMKAMKTRLPIIVFTACLTYQIVTTTLLHKILPKLLHKSNYEHLDTKEISTVQPRKK